MIPIAPHLTAFFQQHLVLERRRSEQTRDSYAYAFKLLLTYASERLKVAPSQLALEQLDAPLVRDFLNALETTRRNGPSSRNARLAAIKSFMHFLEYRVPSALEQIRQILAIPLKQAESRLVRHLTVEGDAGHLGRTRSDRAGRRPRPRDAAPVLRGRIACLRIDRAAR